MNRQKICINEDNYQVKLSEAVKSFKEGREEAPVLVLQGKAISENGKIKMIITKEVYDREGEVIDIAGMDINNYLMNPVLLDAHKMNDSVVSTVLGKLNNVQKSMDANGIKEISGEPEFAPTPAGQIAKALVENGFVQTVSAGFGIMDYDHNTKRVIKSELYETSLVSVPANTMAMISSKGLKTGEAEENEIIKALKNYEKIRPILKEYRRLFLGGDLLKAIGYEKTDNELIDMKNILDKIQLQFKAEDEGEGKKVEDPQPSKVEAPQPKIEGDKQYLQITKEDLVKLVKDIISEI